MRERLLTNLGMLKQNTTHAYIKLLLITIKKSCLEKKEIVMYIFVTYLSLTSIFTFNFLVNFIHRTLKLTKTEV